MIHNIYHSKMLLLNNSGLKLSVFSLALRTILHLLPIGDVKGSFKKKVFTFSPQWFKVLKLRDRVKVFTLLIICSSTLYI